MLEQVEWLMKQPGDILALLSVGYMSYRLAYTGKDGSHSTVDVIFLSFVFASIARMAGWMALPALRRIFEVPPSWLVIIFSVMPALLIAAVWRKWLEEGLFWCLRKLGISASDRQNTVWESMLARSNRPTRLIVRCTDGTRFMCARLSDFSKAPMGPCLLGQDGSVAMYVTDRMLPGATEWEEFQAPGKVDPNWGYEMTFLAASQIAEVRICHPLNPLASEEAELLARSQAAVSLTKV